MPLLLAKMYLYMLLGNNIDMPRRKISFWRKTVELVGEPQLTSIIMQAHPMENKIKADKSKLSKYKLKQMKETTQSNRYQ